MNDRYDPHATPPGCAHGMFVASAIAAEDVGPKKQAPLPPDAELKVVATGSVVINVRPNPVQLEGICAIPQSSQPPSIDRFIDPRTLAPFTEDRLYTFDLQVNGVTVERFSARHAEIRERHDVLAAKPVDEARVEALWNALDADGNGKLDEQELASIFAQMGKKKTQRQVARAFRMMDADRSGSVEYPGEQYSACFAHLEDLITERLQCRCCRISRVVAQTSSRRTLSC